MIKTGTWPLIRVFLWQNNEANEHELQQCRVEELYPRSAKTRFRN